MKRRVDNPDDLPVGTVAFLSHETNILTGDSVWKGSEVPSDNVKRAVVARSRRPVAS